MQPLRFFEDVAAGQALPPLDFEVSLASLVMYAGATWDFHRYHYDPAYAAAQGLGAPIMDGQMVGALLARQLMQWGGPQAFVRRLGYRLRAMVHAGERIIVSGSVTGASREASYGLALCALDVLKADGTQIVRHASAAVELPLRP